MKDIEKSIHIFLEEVEKLCRIEFAYVFGSYARKDNNKNSDIDFAFMIEDNLDKLQAAFIRGSMIEVGKKIFNNDVDIVFLNYDNPLIKYEIIKEGIVVKDSDNRITFESLATREYFDYKYFIDYYDEVMIDSLKSIGGENDGEA